MKLKTIHIWFFSVIALITFSETVSAQDSLMFDNYMTRFQQNLELTNDLYCLPDADFGSEKINKLPLSIFNDSLNKLNLQIFSTPIAETFDFYVFLSELSDQDKKQLIQHFYSNDKYFSETFELAGLPQELKFMAPAFTAMNRKLADVDGRTGIWQLTHFQGILNGLIINYLVDERLNDRLAVQAYVEEIKQNLAVFGSLELAVLAQWYGRAKVQNAIHFADDETSSGQILNFFPENVVEKIAAFQAVAVFLSSNQVLSSINAQPQNLIPDTVFISHQLHFKQVSEVLNIQEKELVCLNPQFRFEIVPENNTRYRLALPTGFYDDFILWQDSIFKALDSTLFDVTAQKIEYPPAPTRQYLGEPVKDLEIEGKTKIQYRLKTGDVLGFIAEKYDVRVADLKYWNNITNERRIQAGKNIDIFVDDEQLDYYRNLDRENEVSTSSTNFASQLQQAATLKIFEALKDAPKVEYVVKSGESPYTIAKKYNGVTPDEILLWNNIDDARKIQVGQKLIIYLKE